MKPDKRIYFPVLIILLSVFSLSCNFSLGVNGDDPVSYPFEEEVDTDVYDELIAFEEEFISNGTVYYVAKDGDDSNPGTEASPWLTIYQATLTAEAGDTIYVKEGTYNESVYFYNSGNETDGYITLSAFEDDEVIIDGTGIPEGYNGIDMDGFINSQGKSYIKFIGFTVQNWSTWFGVYFRGPASHIVIRDCIVTGADSVDLPDDSDDWGGHSFVIWAQVGNSGPIDHVIVEGNEVYNNDTHGNEQLTIYGEVSMFKIINNIVHDGTNINMDMIGRHEYDGVLFGRPTKGLVKGNVTYNSGAGSWGSGIYSDGAGRPEIPDDIIVEDNISYGNVYCGIEMGDEHGDENSGGVLVRNNIVFNNDYYGIHIGASGPDGGTVHNVKIYNNVFYQNTMGELVLDLSNNVELKNNIFYNSELAPYVIVVNENVSNVNLDYNCWYPAAAGPPFFAFAGTEYSGFEEFRSGTGQGIHSINQDPLFVDPAALDFSLQPGSPCLEAGVDVGNDFSGVRPDMGKYFDE